MSFCTPDYNFLSTPEFYKLFLHYFGLLAIPLHILGAFCILFKTPIVMQSVKWSLFNFHFWNCFCDLGFSLLTTPFILIPAFAGYPLGVLSYLGVSAIFQTTFMVTIVNLVNVSVIVLFENRFLVMLNRDHLWRKIRVFYFILNYLFACFVFLPFILIIPDQNYARQFFLDRWKCAPDYAPLDAVLFVTTTTAFPARTAFCVFFYFFVQILIFSVVTGKVLKQQMGRKFSRKTSELLKKFRETLIIQVSIPVCIIFIPLAYLGISNWCWFHFQFLNNISFIVISSHGFFSTIVMLIVHRPYREFAISLTRFGVIYSQNTHVIIEMRTIEDYLSLRVGILYSVEKNVTEKIIKLLPPIIMVFGLICALPHYSTDGYCMQMASPFEFGSILIISKFHSQNLIVVYFNLFIYLSVTITITLLNLLMMLKVRQKKLLSINRSFSQNAKIERTLTGTMIILLFPMIVSLLISIGEINRISYFSYVLFVRPLFVDARVHIVTCYFYFTNPIFKRMSPQSSTVVMSRVTL